MRNCRAAPEHLNKTGDIAFPEPKPESALESLFMWPTRMGLRELLNDVFAGIASLTRRMSEAAAAHTILDIEDQVVT